VRSIEVSLFEPCAVAGVVINRPLQGDDAIQYVFLPARTVLATDLTRMMNKQHRFPGRSLTQASTLNRPPTIGLVLTKTSTDRAQIIDDDKLRIGDYVIVKPLRCWVRKVKQSIRLQVRRDETKMALWRFK
jgi:hypothetical protein